jgi:hypothetical protein
MSKIQRIALLAALTVVASVATVASASAETFSPPGAKFAANSSNTVVTLRGGATPIVCSSVKASGTLPNPAGATATLSPPSFECILTGAWSGMAYATVTASGSWSLGATTTTEVNLKGSGFQVAIGPIIEGKKYAPTCILGLANPISIEGAWSNATRVLTIAKGYFRYVPIPPSSIYNCWLYGVTNGPSTEAQTGQITGSFGLSNTTAPAKPIQVLP